MKFVHIRLIQFAVHFNTFNLFQVPTDFDFVAVMDLFFKLHHVFNLHYHPNLKNFMIFIEHFIYDIDVSPVGANTAKLAKKIIKV